MKTCPYCAEKIQDEAIKCRYCGEFLSRSEPCTTLGPVEEQADDLVVIYTTSLPSRLEAWRGAIAEHCQDSSYRVFDILSSVDEAYFNEHPNVVAIMVWDYDHMPGLEQYHWSNLAKKCRKQLIAKDQITRLQKANRAKRQLSRSSDDIMGQAFGSWHWGSVSPAMVCPHCQVKGHVRTKPAKRKTTISGGKVMGGLLTGGLSLLATGLSRKQAVTQAHCDNCGSTWDF